MGDTFIWKQDAGIEIEELTGTPLSGGCTFIKRLVVSYVCHTGELDFQKYMCKKFPGASALTIKLEGAPMDYSATVYCTHPYTRSRANVVLSDRQLRAQKRRLRGQN